MNITLNEKELRLKELLMVLPPDCDSIEILLSQDAYTVENISKVGTDFVWECVEECWDYFMEENIIRDENVIPNLHSTYICEILSLLLQYGLDPNAIIDQENIMHHLQFLDNGYQAADALVLLFVFKVHTLGKLVMFHSANVFHLPTYNFFNSVKLFS